jgi:hypothetical protein
MSILWNNNDQDKQSRTDLKSTRKILSDAKSSSNSCENGWHHITNIRTWSPSMVWGDRQGPAEHPIARRSIDIYTSIFWFNTQDESTLKCGLAALAAQVMEEQKSASVYDSHEEERMVQ